jgi:hypothetical protein
MPASKAPAMIRGAVTVLELLLSKEPSEEKTPAGGHSSDNDRGGSNDGKCSVRPGVDATSRQSYATSERANSTLLTPLRAQYHKSAAASTAAVMPNSDRGFDRPRRAPRRPPTLAARTPRRRGRGRWHPNLGRRVTCVT